jgi:hypothetical protein
VTGGVVRETLKKLRDGGVVDLCGIFFEMDEGPIQEGDLYIAERNTGPQLLTAKKVVMCECAGCETSCLDSCYTNLPDYIIPTCAAYPYCYEECVKVKEAGI